MVLEQFNFRLFLSTFLGFSVRFSSSFLLDSSNFFDQFLPWLLKLLWFLSFRFVSRSFNPILSSSQLRESFFDSCFDSSHRFYFEPWWWLSWARIGFSLWIVLSLFLTIVNLFFRHGSVITQWFSPRSITHFHHQLLIVLFGLTMSWKSRMIWRIILEMSFLL